MWQREGEVTGIFGIKEGRNSYHDLVCSRSHHMKVSSISVQAHEPAGIDMCAAGTVALQENRPDSQSYYIPF